MKTQTPEEYNGLFIVFGIPPLLCFLVLNLFYFHAAYIVGHLPFYNNPDPKELNIYLNYDITIFILINFSFYLFIPWAIFTLYYGIRFRKHLKNNWKPMTFSLICYGLLISLLSSEIFTWYID